MSDDGSGTFRTTFIYKIPFLILGIAIGMGTVWVALQWVPAAFVSALQ